MKDRIQNCQQQREEYKNLLQLEEGEEATIISSPEHCLLAPLGFRRGKSVKIRSYQPFQGPVVAEIEGRQVAIDRELAAEILLEPEVSINAAG